MNKRPFSSSFRAQTWGALEIATGYFIIGGLWILFSDKIAAKFAPNEAVLIVISLYKGWGYVLITALLLYWLIQRHTTLLQASEKHLQRVLDALPALVSYVGSDRRYQFVNSAYAEWFEGDILGKPVEEVIGISAYQVVSKYIDRVFKGEMVRYETTVTFPDGERFISATYIPDIGRNGQITGFFALIHDVTEQKQAREEQRLWADAFEGCAHGIAIGDPNTNRIVVCNPAFAKLHKSRVEDIVGTAILSLYAPSEHELVRLSIQKADQIGHARFETRMIRKDGSTFPVEMDVVSVLGEDGEVLHRVATAQDISERKQSEQKLQLQARWLEQINDAVINSDPNFVITAWNPGAERIYGWKAEEVIGKRGEELFKTEFFSTTRAEAVQQLQETGEFSAEITQIRKDGSRIYVETHAVAFRDESGRNTGYVSVNRNISERKSSESALKASQEQLLSLIKQAPISIAMFDREMRYIVNSQRWVAEYGRGYEELIGRSHYEIHPDLPERWKEMHRRGLEGETLRNDNDRWIHADGTQNWLRWAIVPWHDGQGEIGGIIISAEDITEAKRAEEALRLKDDLLRLTSELAKVGGWEFDPITGKGTWTDEVAKIHDLDPAQETNVEIGLSFYIGASRQKIEQAVREVIELAKPYDLELEMISAKGNHKWVRAVALPIVHDGQVVKVQGIFQDITVRRQSEENLRRFQLLSENSRDIILFIGYEDGHILEANTAAVQAYGYGHEELLSLSIGDLRAGDTRSLAADQMEQADAGGILFETIHQRKDGSSFPVEVSSQGATIGGTRTLISIIRDIRERKNAEKALTESESRFRSLFEQSADAVLLLENNVFTDCNQATVEMMRAANKEQLLSLHPSRLSPEYQPDGRSSAEAADEMIRIALEKGSHRFEWIHCRMDGSEFSVEVLLTAISTGNRQVIHTVWRDITARKQIEKALQEAHADLERKVQERTSALSEANALLQALMDNIPDHIYFKDLQSRFIRNSRSQATLLGLNNPSDAVGKTDFDFFPHAAQSYADEQEVMKTGKPHVDFEEWVVWPDRREMWVSTTKMPLRNSDGQTIGIFGISRDITERKRTEQAIRQLNADLEKQAEKLQAANKELEAFSYSVSHDLRAPLRAIDGYTRILVEDYESILDDEGKRVCSVISREARRMGQLIDDLLSFSRLGRKEMYSSKIEMRTLVVSILNELLKEEDRERIDVHIAKLPVAKGDSSLIRQVWFNLLSNAIKFTSKKDRAVIEVGSKATKEELIYYVRDNGAGFEMEYANKLFGVFQRLHSESEFSGTGVGLAIVQRIIRRHGGRVWAEGEVEKGATLYFALPRKEILDERQ